MRQKPLSFFKSHLDQFTIVSFVCELHELAASHVQMDQEFHLRCSLILSQQNSANKRQLQELMQIMRVLLFESKSEDELKNGESILFAFLKVNEEVGLSAKLKEAIDLILLEIINNPLPRIRLVFLNAVERLLLLHRSRFQQHGDADRSKLMMKMFNEGMLKFVSAKEKNILVLLRMFYVIIDFFGIYINQVVSQQEEQQESSSSNGNNSSGNNNGGSAAAAAEVKVSKNSGSAAQQKQQEQFAAANKVNENLRLFSQVNIPAGNNNNCNGSSSSLFEDEIMEMFLRGHVCIPNYLLKDISISILHHLFVQLSQQNCEFSQTSMSDHLVKSAQDARAVLLLLIIEKCKSRAVLDSIGGLSFFRVLLNEDHPAIAL